MFNKQKSMIVVASFSLMALVAPIGATLGKAPVVTSKTPAQVQVVDDHGRHAEPGDDRGHGGRGKARRGTSIQRDDHGRGSGEPEPGDDRGRGGNHVEPGDDRGGRTRLGRNGLRIQLLDDRGRGGNHAEPGDDRGGRNR